jgi:hypothetical protein
MIVDILATFSPPLVSEAAQHSADDVGFDRA